MTTSAAPSNATAGDQVLLSSTVTNAGPSPGPIRFTETVPTGVTINAAAAGQGTCSTSGQTVTCAITGLAPRQTAPVDVVVTPTAAGTYATSMSVAVSSPLSDPNAANDTGSATLTVHALTPAPVAKCVVPKLKEIKLSFAKQVVHLLGCAAGTGRKVHSKSIHKGLVIRTNPGPGDVRQRREDRARGLLRTAQKAPQVSKPPRRTPWRVRRAPAGPAGDRTRCSPCLADFSDANHP